MSKYRLELVARVPRRGSAPRFVPVGEVRFNNARYEKTINAIGQLQTSVDVDSIDDDMKMRLRDLVNFPSELWLYRNNLLQFQGPLTNGQVQSGTMTMYAHGLLYYTRYMFITDDLDFRQVDQFTIASRLIRQWQDQDYGHFGIGLNVGTSGIRRDRLYVAAENPNVYDKLGELSEVIDGFDYTVDYKTRQLQLGHPEIGQDRSDLVIFDRRNVNSTSIAMSVQVEDVASDAYGTGTSRNSEGDENIVRSHRFNEETRRRFGKTGIADTFDDVSRQSTADRHTDALLVNRDAMLFTPGPGLRPVAGVDVDDFDAGDRITYSYDAGLGLQTLQRRVLTKAVTASYDGEEDISVELA